MMSESMRSVVTSSFAMAPLSEVKEWWVGSPPPWGNLGCSRYSSESLGVKTRYGGALTAPPVASSSARDLQRVVHLRRVEDLLHGGIVDDERHATSFRSGPCESIPWYAGPYILGRATRCRGGFQTRPARAHHVGRQSRRPTPRVQGPMSRALVIPAAPTSPRSSHGT